MPTAFGANPVASALGKYAGPDPSEPHRNYHGRSIPPTKSERSTLLRTGTFYFALTLQVSHF